MIAATQKLARYRLFQRPAGIDQPRQIIFWWEKRRVAFNFIIGSIGLVTFFAVLGIDEFADRKFGQPISPQGSPILELAAAVMYGVMANVCYTAGWISELIVRNIWKERAGDYGTSAFMLGLFFSIGLTIVPIVFYLGMLIVKSINS